MSDSHAPGVAGLALRIVLAAAGFALVLWLAVRFGDGLAVPLAAGWPATERLPGSLLICAVTLVLVWALWRGLGPRDGDVLGLGALSRAWRPLLVGLLAWAVPAVAGLLVAQALGLVELRVGAGVGAVLAVAGIHLLAVMLAEALPEELLFRGWVHGLLARRSGLLATLVVQSLLFTGVAWLARGGAVGTSDVVMFIAMAAAFGYLRARSGTIWLGVGIHLGFQTASQMLIGGWQGPLSLAGSPTVAMLVLGAVPFAVAINVGDYLARARPRLIAAPGAVAASG